ncbi:hypothetical protein GQ55_9G648300 [Panicum hallii var. hallii]|uniref:Uncharacterized protein n=1 Tax=Panicum hallii var. hallii TaxID=1504633 RepID=A0A2T7CJ50_9POAL|nr:hypothetical protein GQ55_9G648300 [Panicum hallii var. hallii]
MRCDSALLPQGWILEGLFVVPLHSDQGGLEAVKFRNQLIQDLQEEILKGRVGNLSCGPSS